MYKFLSCKNPKRVTHKFLVCTRGHYSHTVPFKSKLTLDSLSSRESRIRIESRIETRFSIVASRFAILDSCADSSNRNGLRLVSSNSLSILDTRLLRESTSNNLCSSLTYWLFWYLSYYKHTLHITYVTLHVYVTYSSNCLLRLPNFQLQ